MGTYTSANLKAPKGESRGAGRDYRGRYQPSYVEVIQERLDNLNRDIAYYQDKFNAALDTGDGKQVGYYAIELDKARKQATRFEVIIAEVTP